MTHSTDTSEWGLIVAFPDGSASFVNGFAAGQIWEAMMWSDPSIERTVRAENEEVIRRMAHAKGYEVAWRLLDDGWAEVALTKTRPARDSSIATGRLSVIEGGLNGGDQP